MLVSIYGTVWRHVPEYHNVNVHFRQNDKSEKLVLCLCEAAGRAGVPVAVGSNDYPRHTLRHTAVKIQFVYGHSECFCGHSVVFL